MKEAKHTPGPWKWWTSNSWKRLMTDHHHHGSATVSVLEPYIVISDNHPDLDVSDADMKLIAAAPDLLEALEPFAKFACDEPCECNNCRARAAIAKATS